MERFSVIVDSRKHAVIGAYKIMLISRHEYRAAWRSDAWVDYDHVHCLRRIVAIGLADGNCAVENIVRHHPMRDVNEHDLGIDVEDHAFHGADKVIVNAVVRGESDDRARQCPLLCCPPHEKICVTILLTLTDAYCTVKASGAIE